MLGRPFRHKLFRPHRRLQQRSLFVETIRILLESQVLFTLFLTIAVGYLVGEINSKGFSLGSGTVLFVGLAIGGFARRRHRPACSARWACSSSSMASASSTARSSSRV